MKQFKLDKKYKFNMDMKQEFLDAHKGNIEVLADLAEFDYTITISSIEDNLVRYGGDYIVYETDIRFFNLFEDTTEELPDMNNTNNIRPDADIVVEWLEKLTYVLQVDQSVADNLNVTPAGILLDADYGSIYGATSIHNFITNRYDLLQQEAKHKKNNDLMERKAKLEAELAEVNKELGEVK